jgi:hypothetical protein
MDDLSNDLDFGRVAFQFADLVVFRFVNIPVREEIQEIVIDSDPQFGLQSLSSVWAYPF